MHAQVAHADERISSFANAWEEAHPGCVCCPVSASSQVCVCICRPPPGGGGGGGGCDVTLGNGNSAASILSFFPTNTLLEQDNGFQKRAFSHVLDIPQRMQNFNQMPPQGRILHSNGIHLLQHMPDGHMDVVHIPVCILDWGYPEFATGSSTATLPVNLH